MVVLVYHYTLDYTLEGYKPSRSFANWFREYIWDTGKCAVESVIEYNCVRSRRMIAVDEIALSVPE